MKIACYKPFIRIEEIGKYKTAKDGHRYADAKIISSDNLEFYDTNNLRYKYTPIPCGKCIGCRLDYSRDWATRGYLESLYYKQNYMVTLTYDDEHLYTPKIMETSKGISYTEVEENDWKGCLVPRDFELFMKRFRERMRTEYKTDKIRFMACGEYGGQFKRPHYHIIFFNCNLPLDSFYDPHVKWEKFIYWKNKIIEETWKKGIVDVTEASWNDIAYVARYITKKMGGEGSEDDYASKGQIQEFFRSSRRPGIGYQYYEDHKEQIYKYDSVMIKTNKGIQFVKPPTYFDKMYEKEHPEDMEIIKAQRRKTALNALKAKAEKTSLTRWEQLQIELSTKERKASALPRDLLRN